MLVVNLYAIFPSTDKNTGANGKDGEEDEDDIDLPEVIRTTYDRPPAPPPMEPLYQLNEDGSLPGTELLSVLGLFISSPY